MKRQASWSDCWAQPSKRRSPPCLAMPERIPMSVRTPAKQPKITYSAIGANMDEAHAEFDAALARVRERYLGKRHHPVIAGKEVSGGGRVFEWRSPPDRSGPRGPFERLSPGPIEDT